MSEKINVLLPKLGESIVSATIVRWCKKVGDPIKRDEALLEVSTDKVNSEIPSPVSGVLIEVRGQEGEELQVGDLLAIIESQDAAQHAVSAPSALVEKQQTGDQMQDFFSPALLRLSREKGVSLEELQKISGTGDGGRVTRKDLEEYVAKKKAPVKPCPAAVIKPHNSDIERMQMSGMRKAIADNMVRSFYEAPHATLVTEVDVTDVLKLIASEKERFFAKHGCKLTITSFIAHALSRALQEFPIINSSLEGDTILLKKFINIGIAVSIEQGLVVPVVRNCQRLSVAALAKGIHEISTKARDNKLTREDISDGTISLTNFGMTGVQIGVPIIRYPEVAIIGIGAISKRVVPLADDLIGIRQMVYVSLTFDHRVLDGIYGCSFLNALKKHIESDLQIDG